MALLVAVAVVGCGDGGYSGWLSSLNSRPTRAPSAADVAEVTAEPTPILEPTASPPPRSSPTPSPTAEPLPESPAGPVLPTFTPTPAGPRTFVQTLPPPTPTATPTPSPTPAEGTATPTATATAFDPRSTAILFLRDRSLSAWDLCGQERFETSLKQIPDFTYRFLANAPHDPALPLYIGLHEFPESPARADWGAPYKLLPVPRTDEERLVFEADWDRRLNQIWDADHVQNPGTAAAIDSGLEALAGVEAQNKHLVIFGDGLLAYNGDSEWAYFTQSGAAGLLIDRLKNAGVRLHYVAYECLPERGTAGAGAAFSANLDKWKDVAGRQMDVMAPFDDSTWIKVHSWTADNGEPLATRQAELSDHQQGDRGGLMPQPALFSGLLHSLLLPLLPPSVEAITDSTTYALLPDGQDLKAIRIPLHGYTTNVDVYFLGYDSGVSLYFDESHERVTDGDGTAADEPLLHLLGGDLEHQPECARHSFYFSDRYRRPLKLRYPALAWWQPVTLEPGTLTVTLPNIQDTDVGLLAQQQTRVEGTLDWAAGSDPIDALQDCYRAEVRPANEPPDSTFARVEALGWPSRIDIPVDPAQPGLELPLEVLIWQKVTPAYTGGESVPQPAWTLVSRRPLDTVRFAYSPALASNAFEPTDEGDGVTAYSVAVDFTDPVYYPTGNAAPDRPHIFALARNQGPTTCRTRMSDSSKPNDGTLPLPQGWYYVLLDEALDEADAFLAGDDDVGSIGLPSSANGAYSFRLEQAALDECGIEFLFIHWDYPVLPIVCSLAQRLCVQTPALPALPTVTAATATE